MKVWKIIVAGIVFAIIAQIIHTVESMATMNFYQDPAYFAVWSKIMMPTAGPPPTEFYIYSIIFGIIAGIIYAMIYSMINKSIPGKTITNKGLYFGFLLFLVGIPWSLTMYLLINLPPLLLVAWSITSLVIDLIFGVIAAKLMK
jgi:uncharacterized membrane protein YeaQ/YmgE (transglycosylase-associated protein family)